MFECFHILEVIIPTDFNFSEGYVYHQPVYFEKSENYSSEPPGVWVSKSYTLRPVDSVTASQVETELRVLNSTEAGTDWISPESIGADCAYKLSKYGWFMLIYPLVNKRRP